MENPSNWYVETELKEKSKETPTEENCKREMVTCKCNIKVMVSKRIDKRKAHFLSTKHKPEFVKVVTKIEKQVFKLAPSLLITIMQKLTSM